MQIPLFGVSLHRTDYPVIAFIKRCLNKILAFGIFSFSNPDLMP